MSAQLVADRALSTFRGLRPLDPRRDLGQVADLIEEAFGDELEAGGQAALRDLRAFARMGPLVGMLTRSELFMGGALSGFVWIEDGRVVGNVTVQPLDPYGTRWQVANVAVAPPYQRRGIARALMTAAMERVREKHGEWAVLQVRADNTVARGLYERLGFEPLTQETLLRLDRLAGRPPQGQSPPGLRPYRPEEWYNRYELEVASHSQLAQWWRPIRSQQFCQSTESRIAEKLWEWLGRNRVRRWVVEGRDGWTAWLSVDGRRWRGVHRLQFTVHPAARGTLEAQLVAFALSFLADFPRWPIEVRHPGEHQEMIAALKGAGFRIVRDHLTMRKRIMP